MRDLSKIAIINLVILLAYTVWILFTNTGSDAALGRMIFMAMAIALHTFINVLLAGVYGLRKQKELAKAYMASSLIVLVIGFSACLGGAQLRI